jgi:MFS family permease
MGIYLLIFMGGSPFGSLIIGWASEGVGTRTTILICGVIAFLVSVTVYAIYRDKVELPKDISVSSILRG